jgi:O-acetyl-ADP-ribose deacetylase
MKINTVVIEDLTLPELEKRYIEIEWAVEQTILPEEVADDLRAEAGLIAERMGELRRERTTSPKMTVVRGDITEFAGGAIVNAANPALARGDGVCGAIFAAADHRWALDRIMRERFPHGCHTGGAVLTESFGLPCTYVIHAVGPVWRDRPYDDDLLRSTYEAALKLAAAHGVESVAFPAISTGVYGFPPMRAAKIAVPTVGQFLAAPERRGSIRSVSFYAFDTVTYEVYHQLLGR